MTRKAKVFYNGTLAGRMEETARGFRFEYDVVYLASPNTRAISATLPKRLKGYESQRLFSFFFGLLAEGSLKNIQCRKLKLDEKDHFGRLLQTCHGDTIGPISIRATKDF